MVPTCINWRKCHILTIDSYIANLLQWFRSDKSQDFFKELCCNWSGWQLWYPVAVQKWLKKSSILHACFAQSYFWYWAYSHIHTPSPKNIQQQEIRSPTVIFTLARCIQAYQIERKACSLTSGQRKRKLGNRWTERLPWWWFTTFFACLPWGDDPIWRAYSFQLGLKLPSR